MSVNHAAQAGRHKLIDRGLDCYETPPEAVVALLESEGNRIPKILWEPACGPGSIVNVLRKHQKLVWATDIADYGCPDSESGVDFLKEDGGVPVAVQAVLTNPPYNLAEQFIRHGLVLVPKVYMLLRLAFLESERRSGILDGGALEKVYVFRNRLPMIHRRGWDGPKASSSIAFAWFCFNREYEGRTTLSRISWRR